jgi:hypothetical protein
MTQWIFNDFTDFTDGASGQLPFQIRGGGGSGCCGAPGGVEAIEVLSVEMVDH